MEISDVKPDIRQKAIQLDQKILVALAQAGLAQADLMGTRRVAHVKFQLVLCYERYSAMVCEFHLIVLERYPLLQYVNVIKAY